ncbi:hypothetical protein NBRGN_001_00010, partial [Nocardia brasiliensis NBRC 14402]
MTRDLPFDDDATEGAERTGDTAYRVATGVARVARAGAYVTGGALIAANGGGVPAAPGSRLDSMNTGWAHNSDPDSGAPSPVITFPDPVIEPAPLNPQHSPNLPVSHGNSGFDLPGTAGGANFPLPTLHGDYNGTDAGLPGLPGTDSGHGFGLPSLPSNAASSDGVPGLGGIPGTDTAQSGGLQLPGTPGNAPNHDLDLPGGQGFGLPGHGLGQAGHGFGLPGANGFVAPGSFDLPGAHPIAGTPSAGTPTGDGPFDGVGGDNLGVFVGTSWQVDFGVGPNGIYFNSEMKVDVGVGQVGDQLDNFTDWLGSALPAQSGGARSATDPTDSN